MPTRLNYTHRKKLTPDEVGIRIHPAGQGPATFEATLNLDRIRPSADEARVFVEAYHQSTRMRFDWGTVAALSPAPPAERRLSEFSDWEHVLFRVKVTDMTDTQGKLLAWRDRIKPKGPEDHPENDLVRFKNEDLDGLVWKIEFEDGPIVSIDHKAGDRHEVGGDPKFRAVVYPEIMRRTLSKAFIEDREDGDDDEHWSYQWLQEFLKPKLGVPDPPPLDDENPSERSEWIDQAVRAFARHHDLNRMWNPEASEAA